jgi:hypothetical protein
VDLSPDGLQNDDDDDDDDNDDSPDIRLLDREDGGTFVFRNVYCLSVDMA